jgi:hypothetical protein
MDNMMQDIVQLFSSFPFHIKDLAPSYHVLHQVGQVHANLALFEVNMDLTHLCADPIPLFGNDMLRSLR